MAKIGEECRKILRGKALILTVLLVLACGIVSAQDLEQVVERKNGAPENASSYFTRIITFLDHSRDMILSHVWPVSI